MHVCLLLWANGLFVYVCTCVYFFSVDDPVCVCVCALLFLVVAVVVIVGLGETIGRETTTEIEITTEILADMVRGKVFFIVRTADV